MTETQTVEMLAMLKVDLGISSTAYDVRLRQYLQTAEAEASREGVGLDFSRIADQSLVVMYAAWLWRRRDSMEGMPRMLRYALNNRIMGAVMEAKGDAEWTEN